MIGGIHALLQQVNQSAQTLTASSEELTASVQQTSGAAEQMAGEASALAVGFEQQTGTIAGLAAATDHMVNRLAHVELIGKEMKQLAGDAGRGFTVVAGEIRKLADDAAVSSRQIADLVAHMQAKTEEAVKSMRKGAERVAIGMERSLGASASFVQIEASISKTANLIRVSR